MSFNYSTDRNVLNLIALLKAHGIKKIIVSPGTTNVCLVASMQQDGFFEMYSCVDERSAAYMAVGMAAESGEPVVITCTEATASRNYYPGITEAYHRKLPVLAITGLHGYRRIGNLDPQVIDRSQSPVDTFKLKVHLPVIKDEEDAEYSVNLINRAILELTRRGGGPVHIDMPWPGGKYDFSEKELPDVRVIKRYTTSDTLPLLPKGKLAVYCGTHVKWKPSLVQAVEEFCKEHNAVVFGNATDGYNGRYSVSTTILGKSQYQIEIFGNIELVIHIGEELGDQTVKKALSKSVRQVWRVSPDGELRNTFGQLSAVFEMEEEVFFRSYVNGAEKGDDSFIERCRECTIAVKNAMPEFPFSNHYLASQIEPNLPEGSTLHLGMSSTVRAWALFEPPQSVSVCANLGCRGIDGTISALIGASQVRKDRLYFGVVGDLTFFYDMNVLGNRHVGRNVRILLINNGGGNIFRKANYSRNMLGMEETNRYIAAEGHFGAKSTALVRHYAEDLGFEYLCASDAEEFQKVRERFLTPELTEKPMLLEAFTTDENEIAASDSVTDLEGRLIKLAKNVLGEQGKSTIKKIIGKRGH